MATLAKPFALIGRILLALLFIIGGVAKLMYQGAYDAQFNANPYLTSFNVGSQWALPLGLFELIAGLLILVGFLTRITSLVLAVYSVLVALFLHNQLNDYTQTQLFLQELAIAGGLLVLFAYGNAAAGFDAMRARRERERERALAIASERDSAQSERDRLAEEREQIERQRDAARARAADAENYTMIDGKRVRVHRSEDL